MRADSRKMELDMIEVKAERARTSRGASHHQNVSRVGFSPLIQPILVRAARRRGISIAGYIRRATLAIIAIDLGIPVEELIEKDIRAASFGNRMNPWSKPGMEIEAQYGSWKVRPDGD